MSTSIRGRLAPNGLVAAIVVLAAPLAAQRAAPVDSGAVVTMLGRDTLGLERWVRSGNSITAQAALRTPRTSLRRYRMELAADGSMARFEERVFDPAEPQRARRVDVVEAREGGWSRTITEGDSVRTSRIESDSRLLPFVDLVHWPYELVLQRALRGELTEQAFLMGNRAVAFPISRSGDQVTIRHPNRGPSVARMDARGRLLSFDGAQATRKVIVTRVPWLELDSAAVRWAAADRAGRGLGELSGRGREEVHVHGAHVVVDYGSPTRRGRDIFGVVVPWGQVWRTGANRATHITTDKPLVLGDPATGTLQVSAGEYTLFSVLAADGGHLIVNRQTGQTGTAYDAAQDLGRVPLQRRMVVDPVEQFTIQVIALNGGQGELRLVWDRSVFAVPFRVIE